MSSAGNRMFGDVAGAFMIVALVLAGSLGAGRALLPVGEVAGSRRPIADSVAALAGLALITWLGGWLIYLGIYSESAGWLLFGLGATALLAQLVRRRPRPGQPRSMERTGGRIAAVLFALVSLGLVTGRALSEYDLPFIAPCDDFTTYFHFPRLLLESGGFVEPFNLRRLAALGAAPFLQGLLWRHLGTVAVPMTDAVAGSLLVWAAARQLPKALGAGSTPQWARELLGLGAVLASFTIWNINTQPSLLPMGGTLVLIVLSQRMTAPENAGAGVRIAIAWGLVAAWLICLRTTNVIFPAVLWLAGAAIAAQHGDREQGRRLAIGALITVVGLLPWCLSLWNSSGTPLFPVIQGNYRFEGLFSEPLGLWGFITFVEDAVWTSRIWILVVLAALAGWRSGTWRLPVQISLALLAMVVVSAATMTAFDTFTIQRYCAPFLAAGMLSLTAQAAFTSIHQRADSVMRWRGPAATAALVVGVLAWLVWPVRLQSEGSAVWLPNVGAIEINLTVRSRAAAKAWKSGLLLPEYSGRHEYEDAQTRLPANARLISAAEKPFLFRFDRHVVHTLDCLGQVSPDPGMPFFEGPELLAQYLRDLGYTHLVFTSPDAGECLYSRPAWESKRDNGKFLWNQWSRYFLDFMENAERVQTSYKVVYIGRELVLVDLRQRR